MNTSAIAHSPAAEPVRDVLHGIEVEDSFRWLEDQESPATRAFIRTEQETYREYLEHHKELRSRIERRVRDLLTVPSVDLPVPDYCGGLLYLKRDAEEEQKAIYRQDSIKAEYLLISVAMLGRDANTSLAIIQVSPDGHYLAFGIRTGGEDVQELGIYDLMERRLLADRLPRGFFRGLVFDRNERCFYYVHEETDGRYQNRRAVRKHTFGVDQRRDCETFYAGDGPRIRLIVRGAEDASSLGYLIVSLDSDLETSFMIHEFPLSNPPREIGHFVGMNFGPRFRSRSLEASTTFEAPRGRIVRFSPECLEKESWNDIIPETDEYLYAWEPWGNSRVVHYIAGRRKLTRVYSDSGRLMRTVEYPPSGTTVFGQVDGDAHRLFYEYSEAGEPPTIFAVDLLTGEQRIWWQQPNSNRRVPHTIEASVYLSKDGTEVPITLIHPRGITGVHPVLLSSYGGGGFSSSPKYSALMIVLLEAGFTCAIAHVRGGGEGGPEWHLAARKRGKQSSVDDLVAAAEWLIGKAYTVPESLGVAGQSAGALLALCALMQQPQLFGAAMAIGPLADLTRFHLFGVARGFVAELGSPEDPEEFAALYRLSPYHHMLRDCNYPATLIISGDRDKRCDSLHARKMIARLREAAAQKNTILLDYTEQRGHKPVLPLSERIRSLSDRLTFLIAELGAILPLDVPS